MATAEVDGKAATVNWFSSLTDFRNEIDPVALQRRDPSIDDNRSRSCVRLAPNGAKAGL